MKLRPHYKNMCYFTKKILIQCVNVNLSVFAMIFFSVLTHGRYRCGIAQSQLVGHRAAMDFTVLYVGCFSTSVLASY